MILPWRKQAPGPDGQGEKGVITIVSGLPRSGTSMMMRMLEAGGMSLLADSIRTADESNPRGYYELERVKKLKDGDTLWVADAQGKAIKVISALLEFLPQPYSYRVVFMQRDLQEVLASQNRMLAAQQKKPGPLTDDQLAGLYQKHLAKVSSWLSEQPNWEVLYVHYNRLMENPEAELARLAGYLSQVPLELPRMLDTIDVSLYRQRHLTGKYSSH